MAARPPRGCGWNARVTRIPRLHAVTDRRILSLPDFEDRARQVAVGPDVAVHVRGDLLGRQLTEITDRVLEIARPGGARVIVNDRVDVALITGAHGAHLPAEGLPTDAARRILGDTALIGRSTHSADEARCALAHGADYVFLGAIWPTSSHPERRPLELDELRAAIPGAVIVIGGVTPQRAREALRLGAVGVAVLSGVWDAPDPAEAVRAFLLSFD